MPAQGVHIGLAEHVDEQQSGRIERLASQESCAKCVENICWNLGGSDVLGDAPSLSIHHRGPRVCTEAADVV